LAPFVQPVFLFPVAAVLLFFLPALIQSLVPALARLVFGVILQLTRDMGQA
jgi:hypothetical protein